MFKFSAVITDVPSQIDVTHSVQFTITVIATIMNSEGLGIVPVTNPQGKEYGQSNFTSSALFFPSFRFILQ
jgi:hypothetical protein